MESATTQSKEVAGTSRTARSERALLICLTIACITYAAVYGLYGERPLLEHPIVWFRVGYVWLFLWMAATSNLKNYYDLVVAYYWYFVLLTLLGTDPGIQSSIGAPLSLSAKTLLVLLVHMAVVMVGARFALRTKGTTAWWNPTDEPRFRVVLESPTVQTAGMLLWLVGTGLALFMFIAYWGYVPLLAPDAENVRVSAQAGLGFLVQPAIVSLQLGALLVFTAATLQQARVWTSRIVLVLTVVLLMGFGFRAIPMALPLQAYIIHAVIRYRRIRLGPLVALGAGMFVVLGLVGYVRYGLSTHALSLKGIIAVAAWRTGIIEIRNLQSLLENFPNNSDFLLGKTFWVDFIALVPGPDANSGMLLKDILGLSFPGAGITPTFPGELYANFGWLGIILGSFAFGYALRALSYVLCERKTIGATVVVGATVAISYIAGLAGGLIGATIFMSIIPMLILAAAAQWLVQILPP